MWGIVGGAIFKGAIVADMENREEEGMESESESEQADRDPPRELTPEEREELRKKIEQARKEDPNIYPIF
jgi:hypothetical protein